MEQIRDLLAGKIDSFVMKTDTSGSQELIWSSQCVGGAG
jgi:hypothetical protein